MAAHDKYSGKRIPWHTHQRRVFRQGWRRTDMYGFERYEDAQRDWYILSGEHEAERYARHDRDRERRCSEQLWSILFGHAQEE